MTGDGEATARLEGELDLATVDDAVAAILGTSGDTVVVDMAEVSFLDSAGLRGLLSASEKLRARGSIDAHREPGRARAARDRGHEHRPAARPRVVAAATSGRLPSLRAREAMSMGYLSFRRSKKVGPFRFFVGKRGVSMSTKAGPLSVSSTGRSSLRLGPGLRWNFGRRRRR